MAFVHSPKIVTDGLVLALDAGNVKSYPGSGTTWSDKSGYGNDGTLINGPTFDSDNGGSIVFDGSNDYVDCGNASSINIPNDLSVNLWIKIGLIDATWRGIIAKRESGGLTNYGINFNSSPNAFQWYFNFWSGFKVLSVPLNTNFTTGIWYNICTIFQKSSTNTLAYIYKNGILLNSGTLSGNVTTSTASLNIGLSSGASGEYFMGNIAITQIYNRALSATEVLQNYNATKGRFGL